MSKIKYRLERWHTVVLFQILEMDEQYRNTRKNIFKSSNNIEIISKCCICLSSSNKIYLRGNCKGYDFSVDTKQFTTESEAQSYLESIDQALTEWNNHVEVMEIEWIKYNKYDCLLGLSEFPEELKFTFGVYKVYILDSEVGNYIRITVNGKTLKVYRYDEHIPLDKTIIMFNRDCELLGIPFRLKESK